MDSVRLQPRQDVLHGDGAETVPTAAFQHSEQFRDFGAAKWALGAWIQWYNQERQHQALGYASPRQYHECQLAKAA